MTKLLTTDSYESNAVLDTCKINTLLFKIILYCKLLIIRIFSPLASVIVLFCKLFMTLEQGYPDCSEFPFILTVKVKIMIHWVMEVTVVRISLHVVS